MVSPLIEPPTRIALGLEYDGRPFCGWQTQTAGCGVQDALETALAVVHGAPVATICAGRTDAGVHARAQVVHFDTVNARPESAWVRGVNAFLPSGVAVLWAQAMPSDFSARFSAIEREYRYRLLVRRSRPALLAGQVGWVHGRLDVALMQAAAQCLIGTHDFSAFRSVDCQAPSPVREMRFVGIEANGEFVDFTFRANAFLHHQIRNLVGALVWIGQGRRPTAWLAEVLASRDRAQAAATFAPDGLYLTAVRYDPRFTLPSSER
jgi:tRNA pseudouridine38-40 synthase